MAWLDDQLNFRWADISPEQTFALTESGLRACARVPQIGVLDTLNPRYLPSIKGEAASRWNSTENLFEESRPESKRALGRRQSRFGNLAFSWGLRGQFVTNWTDAQPWNYSEMIPELLGTPVLQFARKKSQRGQVVLMPLSWFYMGPGSSGLPLDLDPIPFEAKLPRLMWRGRVSGTVQVEERKIWWASSAFQAGQEAMTQLLLPQTARLKLVRALTEAPWADAKLILSEDEQRLLESNPVVQEVLAGVIGDRRSQAEQMAGKFLLVVDGNDFGSNKYWSLLSNSVTLMVESEWETALDVGLEPWVHYVPVAPEREAIEATVDDLLRHPQRCLDIIKAAHALLRPQLDVAMREAADYATLRRYQQQVLCTAALPPTWSLARR